MRSFVLFIFPLALNSQSICRQVNIILQPASVKISNGTFTISSKTVIVANDPEDKKSADFFNAYLQSMYGFKLSKDNAFEDNYIELITKKFIKVTGKK